MAAMLSVFKSASVGAELQIGLKDLIYRLVTDAQDSARGWRFVDARYVFRNTSGAVRFMADRRLGTPTTRCPSTPHTGAAKSKET